MSFWINGKLSCWYIAASLLLYALSPLWFKIREKISFVSVAIVIVFYSLSVLIRLTSLNDLLGHLLIFTFRVPCYFIGLEFGVAYWKSRTLKISKFVFYPLLLFSCVAIVVALGYSPWYIPWAFKYFAYLPVAIAIVIAVCKIPLNKFLLFWGTYSLEIYLTHGNVLYFISKVFRIFSFENYVFLQNITAIIVTCLVAWLLKLICSFVISFQKRNVRI